MVLGDNAHKNYINIDIIFGEMQIWNMKLELIMNNNSNITHGSNNVFEDLGFQDATDRQTKTRLALTINNLVKARHLKQREVAELLGIPQSKVSALKNYRLDLFSVERLMIFLTALNYDVEIIIRPRNTVGVGDIAVLAVQ
jgi:predicted XRE-type DNA-binding protein